MDGLDEMTEGVDETIGMLKKIASESSVKPCVSSRPWNKFEEQFGKTRTNILNVQEVTRHDIEIFVEANIYEHNKHRESEEYNLQYLDLVRAIVDKAEGVFLWVDLAVELLLNGLQEGDNIGDLRKRLDDMPGDLSKHSEHVLYDAVEATYRPQTAQILLLLSHPTTGLLPLFTMHAILDNFQDQRGAMQAELFELSEEKAQKVLVNTEKRLNA